MPELYPLLLKHEFKERIWGARDLSPIYGEVPCEAPVGEVWLTGDECRVANGALTGVTLGDLCRRYGRELVGETAPEANRFPLLVKFLFPRGKLSVQVHPDDATARQAGLLCGKTECWYVLQADPGAKIGLGLKPGTTREQFARAIEGTAAEQLLNWVDIHARDLVYVDAGTVHAIGPGVILLEVQQNSDTTYRLYDYGRPRELHVKEGLAALKERTGAGKVRARSEANAQSTTLVSSPCFVIDKFELQEGKSVQRTIHDDGPIPASAEVLVALNGCGVIQSEGAQPVTLARGDVAVVPASLRGYSIRGQWSVELLRARVPGAKVKEPETTI